MEPRVTLTPAQQAAATGLAKAASTGSLLVLKSAAGMGRTTVLRQAHELIGGALLGARQFMSKLNNRPPAAIEEAFLEMVERALWFRRVVIIDDFHLIRDVAQSFEYPRAHLLNTAMTALLDRATARGRTIILGEDDDGSCAPIGRRGLWFEITDFAVDDYSVICSAYLPPETSKRLDYSRIHRFAPLLNLWQLRKACVCLRHELGLNTDSFIGYLNKHNLTSNVEIEEVRPVSWKDLKGMDDVIRALEAKIALPFENHALATALNLKPRRGVLLAGPPGTGKTTIGRALAHRLKGKFFLIDGTAISGTADFYKTVHQVFQNATKNAPSVIFIDDTDVIFEGDHDRGLYRYLLTKLDGLESEKADRVCVMMTAMDASCLPAALLRSGRIELWLETRLPDEEARYAILRDSLAPLPKPIALANIILLTASSDGLTGADLRTVIEEGKLLFAHDVAKGEPLQPVEEYFLTAIGTVRANRRRYQRRKASTVTEAKIGFERIGA